MTKSSRQRPPRGGLSTKPNDKTTKTETSLHSPPQRHIPVTQSQPTLDESITIKDLLYRNTSDSDPEAALQLYETYANREHITKCWYLEETFSWLFGFTNDPLNNEESMAWIRDNPLINTYFRKAHNHGLKALPYLGLNLMAETVWNRIPTFWITPLMNALSLNRTQSYIHLMASSELTENDSQAIQFFANNSKLTLMKNWRFRFYLLLKLSYDKSYGTPNKSANDQHKSLVK